MGDSTKVCLDLFCGLGGFSAAFEEADDWRVYTVDIEERFEPDLCDDVMDLRPRHLLYPVGDADVLVVLASPPCTDFSMAASRYEKIVDGEPQTMSARQSVALVYHTLGLIHSLSPDYWFVENPQGYLREFIGEPEGRVTYCQYGTSYMKPTDLWGDHPPNFKYRACSYGDDCHSYNTDQEHGGRGNARDEWDIDDPAERSKVPYELSEAIRDACDAALDGEVLEQATIPFNDPNA